MLTRLVSVPLACVAISALPASAALAQARGDFHWEGAVAAGGEVSIHNVNGDVKVTPSSTGRVEVIGTKHGSGRDITAEVHQTSRGLIVCVVFQDADTRCDEDGYSMNSHRNRGDNNWNDASMDLQVTIPANLTVAASSVSGDVDITGAQGSVSGHSVSGDVRMMHLRASSVDANSVSGDIDVQIDELSGRGDLSFRTVSGDVDITVPKQFDADISMSTVSGTMDSDYAMTLTNGRTSRRNIQARIGAGGRRLELNTVSGDVKIRSNR